MKFVKVEKQKKQEKGWSYEKLQIDCCTITKIVTKKYSHIFDWTIISHKMWPNKFSIKHNYSRPYCTWICLTSKFLLLGQVFEKWKIFQSIGSEKIVQYEISSNALRCCHGLIICSTNSIPICSTSDARKGFWVQCGEMQYRRCQETGI